MLDLKLTMWYIKLTKSMQKHRGGDYEIVYRVMGLFEVVEERGYSYRRAIQRLNELEKNVQRRRGYYIKRKIDKNKELGKTYFL